MGKEKAKLALKHLIDRYNSNKHSKDFAGNESQIRRSLIEPFVRDVLGWNIEDPSEFKVESQVSGKRSDILVCLNGLTQFIIEAKSLSAELVDNNEFYKQAIAYAHSKEKTFAILANFRYFVILRCDVEVDNPLKAAIKIINIESYSDKDFDLLYNFNKQVWIEKGEENPLYLKLANYRRRIKVDIQLLEDLKNWRQSIINNLLSHPKQNKYDFSDEKIKYSIEEEVQRFIDRMIFVCYSEDKGFGDAELKSLAELKKDKYFESQSWLLDKIMESSGISLGSKKISDTNLMYHALHKSQGIFYKIEKPSWKVFDEEDVSKRTSTPPPTRALARLKTADALDKKIVSMSWDELMCIGNNEQITYKLPDPFDTEIHPRFR